MKLFSLLIIFPLVFSLFLPLAAHTSFSSAGDVKYLVTFDICNASGAVMGTDSDSPLLHEFANRPVPFESSQYVYPDSLSFRPSSHSVQLEHPPRS